MNPGLLLLIITIASVALAFIDVDVGDVDWKMLGLGAVGAFALLVMVKPGLVQRAARRLGLK